MLENLTMKQFHLTWSDYLTSVSDSFISHRDCDLFTDVTLVSDDNHQVSAHRLILSAGSEYFRNILEDKKHPHPMLCLDGINSSDLNNIIDYLYKGELLIPESSLTQFLKIATKLKCSGLDGIKSFVEVFDRVEIPENGTKSNTTVPDCIDIDTEIINGERIENLKEFVKEDATLNFDSINSIKNSSYSANGTNSHAEHTVLDFIDTEIINGERNLEEFEQVDKSLNFDSNDTDNLCNSNDNEVQKIDLKKESIPIISDSSVLKGHLLEQPQKKQKWYKKSAVKIRSSTYKKSEVPKFCKIEGKIFSYDELKHMTKQLYERQTNGRFQCNYCQFSAINESHLMEHSQKHIDALEFECNCCERVFSSTPKLRSHQFSQWVKKNKS